MAQKLFVGGLPFATSNDQLRDLFAEVGEVASATVVTDRDTGRSRGFCGLEPDLAVRAVAEGLLRRRAAPAERDARLARRVDLVAVDIGQLDLAFDQVRPVRPDGDFDRHARVLLDAELESGSR